MVATRFLSSRCKVVLSTLILALLLSSCGLVRFNGFSNDIGKLSPEQQELVVYKESLSREDFTRHKEERTVLLVTGKSLLEAIPRDRPTVIYEYAPYCKGDLCVPIEGFVELAEKHGMRPIIVLEYMHPDIVGEYDGLYGINDKAYGSSFVGKYDPAFFSDLLGVEVTTKNRGDITRFVLIRPGDKTAYGETYMFPELQKKEEE